MARHGWGPLCIVPANFHSGARALDSKSAATRGSNGRALKFTATVAEAESGMQQY